MLNIPDLETSLTLIIDMQEKLVPAMNDMDKCLERTNILIKGIKELGGKIIISEQYPQGLGPTLEIIRNEIPKNTKIIEKKSFSCLRDPKILSAINTIAPKTLIIAGIETHVCVLQTIMDALKQNYEVVLLSDAVTSRKNSDYITAISQIRHLGALVCSTESLLFMLTKSATNEKFKTISKLIR